MIQVIQQPNGMLCIYSFFLNRMLLENATDSEVISFMLKDAEKYSQLIEARTQDLISAARHLNAPVHKYMLTYEEAQTRIKKGVSNDDKTDR